MHEGLILLAILCLLVVQFLNNLSYSRYVKRAEMRLTSLENGLEACAIDVDRLRNEVF